MSRSRTASSRLLSGPRTAPGWPATWQPARVACVGKRIEVTALHRTATSSSAELTIWPVGSGDDIHFSALVHDITLRKELEMQLQHQAFHDSLTGLANRALFRDRVAHALARQARSHGARLGPLLRPRRLQDRQRLARPRRRRPAAGRGRRAPARSDAPRGHDRAVRRRRVRDPARGDATRPARAGAAERILEALRSPFEFHGRQVVDARQHRRRLHRRTQHRARRPAAPGGPGDVHRQDLAARVASPSTSRACTRRR